MPTYKHEYCITEDSFGEVWVRFVISDSFSGLFSETAEHADVFRPLEMISGLETNYPASNGLNISLEEAAIANAIDSAAADFLIDAIDSTNNRFCAVFINPPSPPDTASMQFCGMIGPDSEETDIFWSGAEYSGEISPLKKRIFRAKPLWEILFSKVKLADLIYGAAPDIQGISAAWESFNVSDSPAWFLRGDKSCMVHRLCGLNEVLRVLADNLSASLNALGYGTFNIEFERSLIDGEFLPARWEHIAYNGAYPRYVYSAETSGINPKAYSVYADDAVRLAIDPDGAPAAGESVWMNYSLIKPDYRGEYNPEEAKEFAWENIYTFRDLLNLLAEQFSMYLEAYIPDTSSIRVRFIPRNGIGADQIYLKDALRAERIVSGEPLPSSKEYTGKAFYLANNGNDCYSRGIGDDKVVNLASEEFNRGLNRKRLPLSISPTQLSLSGPAFDDGESFTQARIPHNHYFADGGVKKEKSYSDACSLHTAIYLYVSKRTGASDENEAYYTPAAKYIVRIDGEDIAFDTLSNYLNVMKKRDRRYFASEYTIKALGWNCFSENSDGALASWEYLKKGAKIILDGISYIVMNIRCSYDSLAFVISLHGSGKFEDVELSVSGDSGETNKIKSVSCPLGGHLKIKMAADEITAGNLVSIRSDGKIEKSFPIEGHYGRLYGIAMNSAYEDEEVLVKTGDRVKILNPALAPGKRYYLRNMEPDSSNIDINILAEPNETEELCADIGVAESADTLLIESGFPNQYLFE